MSSITGTHWHKMARDTAFHTSCAMSRIYCVKSAAYTMNSVTGTGWHRMALYIPKNFLEFGNSRGNEPHRKSFGEYPVPSRARNDYSWQGRTTHEDRSVQV
jgi:hypothetical protein